MIRMNEAQDRAFAFLNDRYGNCLIKEQASENDRSMPGAVKLEGIDEDGDCRARWWVRLDGWVPMAWDPDYALDTYYDKVWKS